MTGWMVAAGMAQEAVKPLRVMSYNLRYINSEDRGSLAWTKRRDLAAELVKQESPDILGVQEGLRPMLDDLHERLDGYAEIGAGRENGKGQGEAAAILVKTNRFTIQESGTFWLSDTPDVVNSATWGNQVVRICTWAKLYDRANDQLFHVFNTHLDHRSEPAQINAAKLIMERIAARSPSGPVLFTGDFNTLEDHVVHQTIRNSPVGLVDVWRTLHTDVPLTEAGTYHNFTGRSDMSRIDFIYASQDVRLLDCDILRFAKNGLYPSDHYPLIATVEFVSKDQP